MTRLEIALALLLALGFAVGRFSAPSCPQDCFTDTECEALYGSEP